MGAAPEQTINYDWLGNTSTTDDDAHGFYDRSLGAITNNSAAGKPYQLVSATNASKGGSRTGSLAAAYDVAGNLTDMAVTRTSTASLCLPSGAGCNQRLHYLWDEVGRLVRAQRWDVATPSLQTLPTTEAVADLTYTYDASDNRVLKSATAKENNVDVQRHSVYVSGGQELRGAQFGSAYLDPGTTGSDYQIDSTTEIAYLFAHGVRLGRVAYDNGAGMPTYSENAVVPAQHVLINLDDTLGSTSIVIDRATSELVEASSYLAHGATESDYRPDRWKGLREDYRFTGKEEDVEVGLQYFGKRLLSPYIGRWVSADPLAVHSPGEGDLNLFAYVHGKVLKATDPVGLADAGSDKQDSLLGRAWKRATEVWNSIDTRKAYLKAVDVSARRIIKPVCDIASGACAGAAKALYSRGNEWEKKLLAEYTKGGPADRTWRLLVTESRDWLSGVKAEGGAVSPMESPTFEQALDQARRSLTRDPDAKESSFHWNGTTTPAFHGPGSFTVSWDIDVTMKRITGEGKPRFETSFRGTMNIRDRWDFDPLDPDKTHRTTQGEAYTRLGQALPGTPFNIESGTLEVHSAGSINSVEISGERKNTDDKK